MAEQERKTKAERRAEARAERKRAEEEAAKHAKKQQVRNGLIAVAVIAVVAIVMIPAAMNLFGGGEEAERTISLEGALEARETAGCEMVVDGQPLEDRTHHDPQSAPPADVMYAQSQVRPTHSGPHFAGTNQLLGGVPNDALDERSTTHNLEHGSMIVWFDPDEVEQSTVDEMEGWMLDRMDIGFQSNAGGGVFVSPYDDITGDKPIAMRTWGQALDCAEWDATVADAMLIDYWGSHGSAPERTLSPYPSGALGYEQDDPQVGDNTEDPTGEGHEPEDVDTEGTTGTDGDADESSPEDPTPTES